MSGTSSAPGTAPAKVRYDGSACLNVRSVVSVCKLLASEGSVAEPLTWGQLSSALWFVETCVTSNKLFFDGTVPQETAAQALDAVEEIKRGRDLRRFQVSAITADSPQDVLNAARDAMAEAHLLLDDANFSFQADIDKPLDQNEHEAFLKRLKRAVSNSPSERESLALEWISDGSRGGKCLAAMIANGDDMLAAAKRLYEKHPGQGALVSAALINRFRLKYVSHLAAGKRSAYVPDPGFECVTKEHIRLFSEYLLKRVREEVKAGPSEANIIAENMKSDDLLPPIGLYALMATKKVRCPAAILETAYNAFRQDSSLMKLIWDNTRGGIALRKGGTAENYVPAIEQHFSDNYKILEEQLAGIKVVTKAQSATSYLVPLIKGAVKAVSKIPGVGLVFDAAGPLWEEKVYPVLREYSIEHSIPVLSDLLTCDSYINQYKKLKFDLQHDPDLQVPLASLSEHVSQVFGRPLKSV